jgi:hypothetical protein
VGGLCQGQELNRQAGSLHRTSEYSAHQPHVMPLYRCTVPQFEGLDKDMAETCYGASIEGALPWHSCWTALPADPLCRCRVLHANACLPALRPMLSLFLVIPPPPAALSLASYASPTPCLS